MTLLRVGLGLLMVCALLLALVVSAPSHAAGAAASLTPGVTLTPTPTRPHSYLPLILKPFAYGTSLYMGSLSTVSAFQYGCEAGQRDLAEPGAQDSLVILDYGQPWVEDGVYGVWNFSGPFGSNAQVGNSVREFARGYWLCTGLDSASHVTLGIGINNYGPFTSDGSCASRAACASVHGQKWEQLVAATQDWVTAQGYAAQVTIAGAIDIEQDWNTPAVTLAWVDGFDDADPQNKYIYYNFGSCTDCPTRLAPNLVPSNGWTAWSVYYVSYGVPPAWPIPEIYVNNGLNARQWAYLSYLAATYWGAPIYYPGLMTEWQACQQFPSGCGQIDNTPLEGFTQLKSELNYWTQTRQADIPLVTDIKWTPRQPDRAGGGDAAAQTLSALRTRLDGPLTGEARSLLQAKAATLEWQAQQRALAAQNAPAKPLSWAAPLELNPAAPRSAEGITTRGQPPLSGMAFAGVNAWAGDVNGAWTVIFAGYNPQDAAQGLLVIYRPESGELNVVSAPSRGGALQVTGLDAGRLALQDASGAVLRFDVSSLAFEP